MAEWGRKKKVYANIEEFQEKACDKLNQIARTQGVFEEYFSVSMKVKYACIVCSRCKYKPLTWFTFKGDPAAPREITFLRFPYGPSMHGCLERHG